MILYKRIHLFHDEAVLVVVTLNRRLEVDLVSTAKLAGDQGLLSDIDFLLLLVLVDLVEVSEDQDPFSSLSSAVIT